MRVYPVNLMLAGRPCAVIGGGAVAERKAVALLEAGAEITVISPALTCRLAALAAQGRIVHTSRPYQTGDVKSYFIVICATNNPEVNRAAATEARRGGALVNVVDAPELCDFTVPAHIARGDILITVSTGGKSPALSRLLREELEARYGPEYGHYLDIVAQVRQDLKAKGGLARDRESFWREAFDSEILGLLRDGKYKEAEEKIRHAASCSGPQS